MDIFSCLNLQPQSLYVLFEHASGYGLFRVKEFEEVATFIPEVEKSTNDVSKFQSLVKLLAFSPFKSGTNALDNMNSISEGSFNRGCTHLINLIIRFLFTVIVSNLNGLFVSKAQENIYSSVFSLRFNYRPHKNAAQKSIFKKIIVFLTQFCS